MTNLFIGEMAAIIDAMYQTFINYDEEYEFYNKLIQENNCTSILEIGSGAGNLAKRFHENNQNYLGLDHSQSMIDIAHKKNKDSVFILADMRHFELETAVDAIIITERSTSYLINNEDIIDAFESAYKNLNPNGVFIFDFIDANRFIPFIKENQLITHEVTYEGVQYIRESQWETTPLENFLLDWRVKYFRNIENNEKEMLLDDFSTVRVFTLNEIQLFLYLNKFQIIKTIDRETYAYDTYVIVAKKIL